MRQVRHGESGVTLIEILVSLAIFAVIGIASLNVLDAVARTGERSDEQLDRLAEIDHAFLVIRRDLSQSVGLETRLDKEGLTFRRTQMGETLEMSYRLDDAILLREIRPTDTSPMSQLMLTGLANARWRLLTGSRRWTSLWPAEGKSAAHRPLAVELTIEVMRDGYAFPQSVTRVFALPAGQGR
ncbi:type II secretion system protein GspJ [uncultured Roseovarius sp.]|uniref:type II secretion system protein GspJ n=1 Tax=uncultured Roseovarius sp. TaxID=293344 RepID=UPI00263493B9|nr:type II secretion system protein GspJ [uncultured Roseovarius sp.]